MKAVVEIDLDDLGLEDDLALQIVLRIVEISPDVAQFARHRTHDDEAGMPVDHDRTTLAITDDRDQRVPQFGPEIGHAASVDAARFYRP